MKGEGVVQDHHEALKWFALSADQGDVNAQENLASLYVHGHCMPEDLVAAYSWMLLAAAKVEKDRKFLQQFESRMSSEQLSKAKRQANAWTSAHNTAPPIRF